LRKPHLIFDLNKKPLEKSGGFFIFKKFPGRIGMIAAWLIILRVSGKR